MQEKTNTVNLIDKLTSDDFLNYCKTEVIPMLEPVEHIRVKKLGIIKVLKKLLNFCLYLVLIAFAIAFLLVLISGNDSHSPLAQLSMKMSTTSFISMFVCIFCGFILKSIVNPIIEDVKARVYNTLLSYFGTFNYYNKQLDTKDGVYSLLRYKLENLKIFKKFNRYSCDDYITGVYNGLNLTIADVLLTQVRGSGKSRTTETIFDGVFIESDCNKKFNSTTVVRIDEGALGNLVQTNAIHLQKVNLEDAVFEQKFEVYSDDQVEARYLLTTAFMERLLKVQKRLKMPVTCSFENGKMYIAIHDSKNWFDIDVEDSSLVDIRTYQKILLDIASVLSVLDLLKADFDTGM